MRDCPSEKSILNRRTVLIAAAGAAPLLAGIAGVEAAANVSQVAAHYQTTPKGDQFCGNCAHFVPPTACKLVEGGISPGGGADCMRKRRARTCKV